MAGGKVSARVMQLAERRAAVVELRVQGGSLRAIAQQMQALPDEDRARLGITPSYGEKAVHKDLLAELQRLNAISTEGIAEHRRLELAQLDALLTSWWPRAEAGDPAAFDRVERLLLRRAKLTGAEPPPVATGAAVDLVTWSPEAWRAEIAKRQQEVAEVLALKSKTE